jgi:hypothetical protein
MKWLYLYSSSAARQRLGHDVLIGLAAAALWGVLAAGLAAILVAIYFD